MRTRGGYMLELEDIEINEFEPIIAPLTGLLWRIPPKLDIAKELSIATTPMDQPVWNLASSTWQFYAPRPLTNTKIPPKDIDAPPAAKPQDEDDEE
jgi:hypothetical protein